MKKLNLLFTTEGLCFQRLKNRSVLAENHCFISEGEAPGALTAALEKVLGEEAVDSIQVVSALNHFALMPAGFAEHHLGFDLIALNAPVDSEKEELILALNKKYDVQFYYAFPKEWYHLIKSTKAKSHFTFSGEKFLQALQPKNQKEIHINLYHGQCEFVALDRKKILLYNNLDVNSEVDFLYFIMFTLSKIGFGTDETQFYVYGETTENETFISELQKFVRSLKIVFDNIPRKNFVLH